jgi:hypothetical protein
MYWVYGIIDGFPENSRQEQSRVCDSELHFLTAVLRFNGKSICSYVVARSAPSILNFDPKV